MSLGFTKEFRWRVQLSAAALKWKARLDKDREILFTFLHYDGVSWNNNNAEHAIKAFARLRRTIEGLSTPKGIEEYLILLSVLSDVQILRPGLSGVSPLRRNGHQYLRCHPTKTEAGTKLTPSDHRPTVYAGLGPRHRGGYAVTGPAIRLSVSRYFHGIH